MPGARPDADARGLPSLRRGRAQHDIPARPARYGYDDEDCRRRGLAGLAAVGVAGLLLYGLFSGFGARLVEHVVSGKTVVELIPAPAAVPEAEPAKAAAPEPEGAAAPPNERATPKPVSAPKPKVVVVPPKMPVPPVSGQGADASAGAAPTPGPGTGAGGEGTGLGAGTGGSGTGGGGGVTKPRWISGAIRNRDYPREASRAKQGGSVTVRYTVGADGRVRDCRVMKTSGVGAIDDTTCRLIEQRFRYEPARDASGRAVAADTGWRQDWWLEPRRDGQAVPPGAGPPPSNS